MYQYSSVLLRALAVEDRAYLEWLAALLREQPTILDRNLVYLTNLFKIHTGTFSEKVHVRVT